MLITKEIEFDMAHRVQNHKSKCCNLHGHRYRVEVGVDDKVITTKDAPDEGMVIDFGDLKKIVKEQIVDIFDHATVFNQTTPHVELAAELKNRGHHVILVDYQPTSENMVIDFAKRIISRLPAGISLFSLKLQETDSSFAEWFASDNM